MRYSPRGCKESDTTKRLSTAQQEARVPHTSQPKKPKHKTKAISNKLNKDVKNGPHQKKKRLSSANPNLPLHPSPSLGVAF